MPLISVFGEVVLLDVHIDVHILDCYHTCNVQVNNAELFLTPDVENNI